MSTLHDLPIKNERCAPFDFTAAAILAAAAVIVAVTFRDYGITWDEDVQNTYGQKLLAFYLSGFRDTSAFEYLNLWFYGGAFDIAAALINRVSPFGVFETRHLLGGLVGVVGAVGIWRLARLMGGPRAALLALIVALSTPLLVGHSFINPKDAPFAWATVWTVYFMCRLVSGDERPGFTVAGLGCALGLALGMRVAALAYPLYALSAAAVLDVVAARSKSAPLGFPVLRRTAGALARATPIALAIVAFTWPWVMLSPFNIATAIEEFAAFPYDAAILWNGRMVESENLPASYIVVLLWFQLPEIVLAGLAAGTSLCIAAIWRPRWWTQLTARHAALAIVAMAAVVPLAAFTVFRPTAYNGMRHFLFVVPPLVVLAALGLNALLTHFVARHAKAGAVIVVAMTALIARQAAGMIETHPYQYISFNALVGGWHGAVGRFELDYWGSTLAEAAHDFGAWLDANTGSCGAPCVKLVMCGNPMSIQPFLERGIELTENPADADYYIGMTAPVCDRYARLDAEVIGDVERAGVTLALIKRLKHGDPQPP